MTIINTEDISSQKKIPIEKIKPLIAIKKRWQDNDIILNMGFRESLIRGAIVLFLPWPLIAIDPNILLYAAPLMIYLFISSLVHFCIFKYAWQHFVQHKVTPEVCDISKELDIPVDHI